MGTFQQRFEIDQPVSAVYNAFLQPESLLREVPGITRVSRAGEDLYRLAAGYAGREVELAIVSKTPPTAIEWRTADGTWSGAVGLEAVAPERTAVTIIIEGNAASDASSPSATQLHEALHALKRSLQRAGTRAGMQGDAPGFDARRYASEWRDTARTAFTRPTEFPLTFMRTLSRQMERVWDDVLRGSPIARLPQMVPGLPWNPGVEVREEGQQVRVRVDVPGVDESHLEVEIDEGQLTVRGERQDDAAGADGQRHTEARYGSFTRRIPIPTGVDADSAKAVLRNGVLEVSIPLQRKAPRRVPVQRAGTDRA